MLLFALGLVIVRSLREHVVQAGDQAPDFAITTDRGLRLTPGNFGGRVLVLNFWASWCAPCVEETPSLDQFQRSLADSGVVVLAISVDRNEKLYNSFIQRFHPAYQTARDPDASIGDLYGTYKYPETYIIDRTGKVVQKMIGARNWTDPELLSYVKSLL